MKKLGLIIIFIAINLSSLADIPPFYISTGYHFSRSALRDFNEFIELYNENPSKLNNYVFDHGFDKLHCLKGFGFGAGVFVKGFDFSFEYFRKFNHTFAYYDPAINPSYLRVDIGIGVRTYEFTALKQLEYENIIISPGVGLGYTIRDLYYWDDRVLQTTPKYKDMVSKETISSLSFTPTLLASYRPIKKLPVDLFSKVYWQMIFKRLPVSYLGNFKGYWTASEAATKKVSCGNIGIQFGIRVIIPSLKIKLPEPKHTEVAIKQEPIIKGTVSNKNNDKPVVAVVVLYANGKPVSSQVTNSGTYEFHCQHNIEYTIEAKAFGFITKNVEVKLTESSMNPYVLDFKLEPMKVGETIHLENILFKKASADLLPASYVELEKLYRFLLNSPGSVIEIAGHTSSEGDEKYNQKLSQERAKAIADYLISKGIDKDRLVPKGYGESKPIADNSTEEGRIKNRRVEIKIIKLP